MSKKTATKSTSGKPAARAPRAAARPAAAGRPTSATSAASRAAAGSKAATAGTSPAVDAASKKPAARANASAAQPVREPAPSTAPGTAPTAPTPSEPPRGHGHGAADLADRIVASADTSSVQSHAEHLMSDKPTSAAASARVLEELLGKKPDMLVPVIDRLVAVIVSGPKRSVQTAAAALPVMARLAPARVARHLPMLTEKFGEASEQGKDGLVSTFAALCTASVAYQKRLEPVLELALSKAEPKTLQRWTETVLPSLKGEPHARARAVVEDRLHQIPRQHAQPIATFLGIKLRPVAAK